MRTIHMPKNPNDLLPFPQNVGASLTSHGATSDQVRFVYSALAEHFDENAEPLSIEMGSIGTLIIDGIQNEIRLTKGSRTIEVCHINTGKLVEE